MAVEYQERLQTLRQLHQFYTEEARHQRAMMWDTVKWFTTILTALLGGWFWLYQLWKGCHLSYWWLLGAGVGGMLLALYCLNLLRQFYHTNLIYITMFVKIENELGINYRDNRMFYKDDDKITYSEYWNDRTEYVKDKQFVENTMYKGTMHIWMRMVFILYFFAFTILALFSFFSLINSELSKWTAFIITLLIAAIIILLLSCYSSIWLTIKNALGLQRKAND